MHDSPPKAEVAAAAGFAAAQETKRQRIRLLIRAAGMLPVLLILCGGFHFLSDGRFFTGQNLGIVLQQAVLYGVLGYIPGFALSLILYDWGSVATTLPITMTWERAVAVLILSVLMCAVSGFFAVKKVRTADPADLF